MEDVLIDALVLSERDLASVRQCMKVLISPLKYQHPDDWRAAVNRALKSLLDADFATFQLRYPGIETLLSDELDQSALEGYLPFVVALDPKFANALPRTAELEVCNRPMLWGNEIDEFYASVYYNELIVPNQAFDMLCAAAPAEDGRLPATIYFHHSRPSGLKFGERGLQLLRLLYPTFCAGVRAFERFHRRRAALFRAVDEARRAVWVFDADGRLLHRNREAGMVFSSDPDAKKLDAAAEDLAAGIGALVSARARRRELPGSCRRKVWLGSRTVVLEGSILGRTGELQEPAVLVTVREEENPPGTSGPPLTGAVRFQIGERYNLTPRESEVALLLARRLTNREIADRLGISVHTARRHTERVFQKLGIGSRRDVAPKLHPPHQQL